MEGMGTRGGRLSRIRSAEKGTASSLLASRLERCSRMATCVSEPAMKVNSSCQDLELVSLAASLLLKEKRKASRFWGRELRYSESRYEKSSSFQRIGNRY